jgi:predicted component of type VI protein secretion system
MSTVEEEEVETWQAISATRDTRYVGIHLPITKLVSLSLKLQINK